MTDWSYDFEKIIIKDLNLLFLDVDGNVQCIINHFKGEKNVFN